MNIGNRHSQHSFAQTPAVNMARSQFDRSFNIKDTFDFDYLVPIFCDEILPGDTANVTLNAFARLATQKVPIMDNMYIEFFFFFVPNRLVWTNWERFCGAQDDPGDSTDYVIPTVSAPTTVGFLTGSIYDHFGIPVGKDTFAVNALPFRSYNLIWNSWFRDQNLQDSVLVNKDDGPDLDTECVLLKRGKRHDYFTSCLPEPQRGSPVSIIGNDQLVVERINNGGGVKLFVGGTQTNSAQPVNLVTSTTGGTTRMSDGTNGISIDPNGSLIVDGLLDILSVQGVREAFQMQSIFELDMRGGTRYPEILLSHFSVVSPDARIQRPEFLGGGRTNINSHPVPQTSPTSGANAQAQLASFATASTGGNNIGFTKSFTEHGYVIGLAAARADITYQGGLNKMWSRTTRFDFFWPKLQEIGEQSVFNFELVLTGDLLKDLPVFGYQERFAEYRYKPSEIRGEFRSQFATPLDMWHLAEDLDIDTEIVLNEDFIQSSTPIERILAISGAPHILFDCFFSYKHARPMMMYSIPTGLGRF